MYLKYNANVNFLVLLFFSYVRCYMGSLFFKKSILLFCNYFWVCNYFK